METVEPGPTIRIGDRTLTIFERTIVEHYDTKSGFVVSARKEPSAVRVRERDEEYTLSLDVDAC